MPRFILERKIIESNGDGAKNGDDRSVWTAILVDGRRVR
jgi:hypothetical protein